MYNCEKMKGYNMIQESIKVLVTLVLLSNLVLFAEVDLQENFYDAAEEMMRFDEKMNRAIAEHNEIDSEEDEKFRLNDLTIEDFEETAEGYILKQTIEDTNNTQIELTMSNGMLTIETTIREHKVIRNENEITTETTMSTSSTSLYIPNDADENTLREQYKNNTLEITFRKK